jgi:DNA-binding MarR family transcriptional regulator
MKTQGIKAQIREILATATDRIVAALSKLPPAQWPTAVKSPKSVRAERDDDEPRSSKGNNKVRGRGGRKPSVKKKAERDNGAERKKRSHSTVETLRWRVLQAVGGSTDGLRIGEIATAIDQDVRAISFPMESLRAKGLVRMEGSRSKSRWFVTDAGKAATRESLAEAFAGRAKPAAKAAPSQEPSDSVGEPAEGEGSPAEGGQGAPRGDSETLSG